LKIFHRKILDCTGDTHTLNLAKFIHSFNNQFFDPYFTDKSLVACSQRKRREIVSNQIDYELWLDEIKKSNHKYESLFAEAGAYPPIFFFGDPAGAVAATVGVNPSAGEFSKHRNWSSQDAKPRPLLERCRKYFDEPMAIPAHPWFQVCENFLRKIGVSYTASPRVVHLDFSPRATRSMRSLQKESEDLLELFLNLVENDLKYFIAQLQAYPSIKNLYVAGSVTKKYYGVEFLAENSRNLGYTLKPVMPFRRGGRGQVGLYKLHVRDADPKWLFFCSTSPSARVKPHPLPQKADWLKKYHPRFLPACAHSGAFS